MKCSFGEENVEHKRPEPQLRRIFFWDRPIRTHARRFIAKRIMGSPDVNARRSRFFTQPVRWYAARASLRWRPDAKHPPQPMTEAQMQYLLMIYSEEDRWNQMSDSERQQGVAAYQAYTESLKKAEVLAGANRLQHTSTATTVRLVDGKPQVLDGPFSDSKEQLAGYYLIDVPNLDAAIAWASRCPGAAHGLMEVRPVWTAPYDAPSVA
jgi:hypothetical protein